jgi:dihydropteroate synthase
MPVTAITSEKRRLMEEIAAVGADPYAVKLWEKGVPLALKLTVSSAFISNIIKQEAISSGIDAAVNRGAANCSVKENSLIIIGNVRGVKILASRLKRQEGVFAEIAAELEQAVNPNEGLYTLTLRDRELLLKSVVMGILNVTPDSFSDGGSYDTLPKIIDRLRQIFDEGGLIADIGGVSTRPGYSPVERDEEEKRVLPAVEAGVKIASEYGGFISVDTMDASIAEAVLKAGADIINDQSALNGRGMAEVCAKYKAAVVLMNNPESVAEEIPAAIERIKSDLARAGERAVNAGISRNSILLDPGFGFGKSLKIQYGLLKYLHELCSLAYPMLVGVSRKSMLGRITGKDASDRAYSTAAAETAAALAGACVLRSHNVAAARDVFKIVEAIKGGQTAPPEVITWTL